MHRTSREVVLALVLAATAAAVCFATTPKYLATGAVLLPHGMVRAQYAESDPRAALARIEEFVRGHPEALFVDRPIVTAASPAYWQAGLAAAVVIALAFFLRRRSIRVRSERELVALVGEPLVAARPLAAAHLREQLRQCWFGRGRALLAVVSPEAADGGSAVAVQIARAFAAAGEQTLLIDADLRAPGVHRAFGLPNRRGLADLLDGGMPRLAHPAQNLDVLVAGRAREYPLELLSRKQLRKLLAAASRRYGAVIVATPAAAQGPDFQIFAALAGGALLVTRHPANAAALQHVRSLLDPCRARVVGTVLNPT